MGSITAVGRNRKRLDELSAAGFGLAATGFADTEKVAELVDRHRDIGDLRQRLLSPRPASVSDRGRFPIIADHKATEDALTYTIVRNTWYIENYLQALGGPRRTGILAASGDPVVAAATRKDLGEALVVVRESSHQDKRSRTISGS